MANDFASVIARLAEMQVGLDAHLEDGLDRAARIVRAEARREIGTYQDADGGFPGWAELSETTKDERAREGYTENDPGLRSGEMRDSIGIAGEGLVRYVGSDDDKLVWFELGTAKQPPRSVLGLAATHKALEILGAVGISAEAALIGDGVVNGRIVIGGSGED